MASFLLSECLENIFSNLIQHPFNDNKTKITQISTKDLHSCTLVSRHWCRISTPFLYAYPFHHFDFDYLTYGSYFKLIRTLLSCIPQTEIKQIYTPNTQVLSTEHTPLNKKDSHSNISPTFNYVSFICGFIFNEIILEPRNVYYYKEILLSAHNPERISPEQAVRIMNHLIKFICKHCNNFTVLEFVFGILDYYDIDKLVPVSLQNKANSVFNLLSTKSLTRLIEIGIENHTNRSYSIPEDFLIQLFQYSSNTLTKLVIDDGNRDQR